MKYFRTYPLFLQVLLFLLMVFTMVSFATLLANVIVPRVTGFGFAAAIGADEKSSAELLRAKMLAGQITNAGLFLIHAVLFAYLAHPRPMGYVGLRKPGQPAQWLAVLLITAGMIPLLSGLQEVVQLLPFSPTIKAEQASTGAYFTRLVAEAPVGAFVAIFLSIAVITPLQEELFFRGILMRFVHKSTHRTMFAVLVSATLFASLHLNQPLALLSVLVAGVVLGLVYALTGSLWLSVWMHVLFNGSQVLMLRFAPAQARAAESHLPWWAYVAGAVAFVSGWMWLRKIQTPLKADWSDDFAGEQAAGLDMKLPDR